MTRLFSFRFDVDTHRCVREGMPALSRLGRKLDAPFTFFVNMGRAVSWRAKVRSVAGTGREAGAPAARAGGSGAAARGAAKHPARRKLGTAEWLRAAIVNPPVGSGSPEVLRGALDDGHELGLHGGLNHAVWQAEAAGWSPDRVAAEIDAVLPGFERILGGTPPGFASPGWVTPPGLADILAERGFRYWADAHGPPEVTTREALPSVRTGLTGEPGGVAYLEHLDAAGLSPSEALARFESDLERAGDVVVVYDHPYWAGVRALPLVERMVGIARAAGFDVVPLVAIACREEGAS